jgi:hypothetical protein
LENIKKTLGRCRCNDSLISEWKCRLDSHLPSTIRKYNLYPLINELSDHDAQLLILNMGQKKENEYHTYTKRKVNKYTIADFQLILSHETWEQVFDEKDF